MDANPSLAEYVASCWGDVETFERATADFAEDLHGAIKTQGVEPVMAMCGLLRLAAAMAAGISYKNTAANRALFFQTLSTMFEEAWMAYCESEPSPRRLTGQGVRDFDGKTE